MTTDDDFAFLEPVDAGMVAEAARIRAALCAARGLPPSSGCAAAKVSSHRPAASGDRAAGGVCAVAHVVAGERQA